MKNLRRLLLFVILSMTILLNLPVVSYGAAGNNKNELPSGLAYEGVPSAIEDYVKEHIKTTAGMSLALYDSEGIIYRNSFGYADKEAKLNVDENTVFEWGSTSKLFIWISAMQLVEEGKLDLSADIRGYLPDDFLKNLSYDMPITMIDLMNHQGGFQDTYFIQTSDPDEMVSLKEALSRKQPKQVYEPGTVTAYSNWGASLAAFIVENISGTDYAEYVHKNIFEPLSMKKTSIAATYEDNEWVKQKRNELACYDIEGNKIAGKGIYYIFLYPAGSAAGTVGDLLTFARAITPDEDSPCPLFKKRDTLGEMYTATSFYGDSGVGNNYHGFFANQYKVSVLGHGGNTFGCSTMLQFDPETGVGMVVMTNQAHESIYNYDMYELIFGKFSESELAKIEREVPKGMVINTRGISEGPLAFLGAMGILSYSDEDLSSWWYMDGDYVYGGYSDYIVSTTRSALNIISILLFIIAGLYGMVTAIVGGLIFSPIRSRINRRRGLEIKYPFRKWNYTVSALMALIFVDVAVIFARINKGNITGEIGKIESYMFQSGVVGILAIILTAALIYGIISRSKKQVAGRRKEQVKYIFTAMFALCMLAVIMMFDMYQFWAI